MRLKGIKRYKHPKTGRWYCYHRASGTRIEAEFGTAAFVAELAAIEAKQKPKKQDPGTLGMLFDFYGRSTAFQALKPRVRKGYEDAIKFLLDRAAAMPIEEVTPGFVAQLRDRVQTQRTWHFANDVRKCCPSRFRWPVRLGLLIKTPSRTPSVPNVQRANLGATAPGNIMSASR